MIIFDFQCCWSSCRSSRRDWPTDEYSPGVAGLGRASIEKTVDARPSSAEPFLLGAFSLFFCLLKRIFRVCVRIFAVILIGIEKGRPSKAVCCGQEKGQLILYCHLSIPFVASLFVFPVGFWVYPVYLCMRKICS